MLTVTRMMENTSVLLPSGAYRVEKILGISIDQTNTRSFKVQLVPSWVDEVNLVGCERRITDFLQEQQEQVPRNTEVSNRFPCQMKAEDDRVNVQESFEISSDEGIHFQPSKSLESFKGTFPNTCNTLVNHSERNNVDDLCIVESLEDSTPNPMNPPNQLSESIGLHEVSPDQEMPQEQQQESASISKTQQCQLLREKQQLKQQTQLQQQGAHQRQEQQQQQQPLQQQKQQQNLQQNQPSYEFLMSFYMENVEHIKDCKACKLQKLSEVQSGPRSFNYEEEDIFQPYTATHSIFLHVANNVIERRDLISKGNNKIERSKAVDEILSILDINNTVENAQRISKRLGKLINSKKHASKIKKHAAKLGISYNRYRSKYTKRRYENEEDNESEISTVTNEVPSQDANL